MAKDRWIKRHGFIGQRHGSASSTGAKDANKSGKAAKDSTKSEYEGAGILSLSEDPKIRWKKTAEELAPEVDCPPSPWSEVPDDADLSKDCDISISHSADRIKVEVTRFSDDSGVLISLDTKGTEQWRIDIPSGRELSCWDDTDRSLLWCLDTPSLGSEDTTRATLRIYDLDSGKPQSSVDIPGGGEYTSLGSLD